MICILAHFFFFSEKGLLVCSHEQCNSVGVNKDTNPYGERVDSSQAFVTSRTNKHKA